MSKKLKSDEEVQRHKDSTYRQKAIIKTMGRHLQMTTFVNQCLIHNIRYKVHQIAERFDIDLTED